MSGPPPPIHANCAIADADAPVIVPATHPLVVATPFLGWRPTAAGAGGAAMVMLSTWQMILAFGRCFYASRTPADLPATRRAHPLNLGLTGAFWTRALNEYLSSGLLNHTMSSRVELHAALDGLTLTNAANLSVAAADWLLGEDTVGTPGVPPVAPVAAQARVPARGRRGTAGYVPAVPAVGAVPGRPGIPGRPALEAALNYLTLIDVIGLEEAGNSPWALISFLAGLLGACLSQAERNRSASQVQLAGRSLAAGCAGRFGTAVTEPHSIAADLRDFLRIVSRALPAEMLSTGVDSAELRAEGRDAMLYVRDAAGRRHVEEARIHSFGSMCAPPSPLYSPMPASPREPRAPSPACDPPERAGRFSERPVAGGEIAMRRAFRSLEVSGAIRSPEGLAGCE